jgi:hypothetical protein
MENDKNTTWEIEMKRAQLGIASFGVLAMFLSLPANAGEKVAGHNFDIQSLSEMTAAIPDKPDRAMKQTTAVWKSTGTSDLANFWASAVTQQEVVGNDTKIKGYGTSHFGNGDVANFVWEGNAKVTPKEAGAFDSVEQGTFSWIGGTGKHNVTGPGTYTCKFNQSGGACDWQGEADYSAM